MARDPPHRVRLPDHQGHPDRETYRGSLVRGDHENLAAESLYPTPSRPELVAASRQSFCEAEKLGDELIDSFYKEHPELAPPDKRADYWAMKLTEQEEVARKVAPVLDKFENQLPRQQQTVGRWRFISPVSYTHLTLPTSDLV